MPKYCDVDYENLREYLSHEEFELIVSELNGNDYMDLGFYHEDIDDLEF